MASYQQTVLADAPILYYRCEETSGATCNDASGNGHTGTCHTGFTRNVSMGPAGLDIGVTLDGTAGTNITTPNSAALNLIVPVSYECWLKWTSATTGVIFSQGVDTNGGYEWVLFSTGLMTIANAASGTHQFDQVGGALSTGTLYHLVWTFKTGPDLNTFYINGVSNNTNSTATVVSSTQSTQSFGFGGQMNSGGVQFPLPATMDEMAIYNYALSSSQVAAHYAARNTATGSSPASNTAPPGQAIAALAHDRNLQRKEQEQPGRRLRISDYHKHRRHG